MLVFIDESGDTGFKQASSRYFILTMIVFNNPTGDGRYPNAEATARAIKEVMERTRQKPEFHFTACSQRNRLAFFQWINETGCAFCVYSMVVDKKLITSGELKKSSGKFYNFFLKQLLTRNPVVGATIKIDGQKSKEFRKALQAYLRKEQDGLLKKLKFCDSKEDVLVQLADMACGAIAYSYNRADRMEPDVYVSMLGDRVCNVWEFK